MHPLSPFSSKMLIILCVELLLFRRSVRTHGTTSRSLPNMTGGLQLINSHPLFISCLNHSNRKHEFERQNLSNPGDSPETTMRNKTTEFLTDAAERIIVMTKVYTRLKRSDIKECKARYQDLIQLNVKRTHITKQ